MSLVEDKEKKAPLLHHPRENGHDRQAYRNVRHRRTDTQPCSALAPRAARVQRAHVSPYGRSQRTIPDESPALPLSEPVINEERDWPLCLFRPLVSDISLLKSSAEVSAIKT